MQHLRIRGFIGGIIPVLVMGAMLFLSAGTLRWPMAWIFTGIFVSGTVILAVKASPALIAERSRIRPGMNGWDWVLARIIMVFFFAVLILAGLDMRFGWSGSLPLFVPILSLTLFIFGNALVLWAEITNQYFSVIFRIPDDRGHRVVSGGPYRFVRHPGYAGMILYILFLPPMLGSLFALAPAVIAAGLFVLRTRTEDRALGRELPGYPEYTERVRYRLIPGVW